MTADSHHLDASARHAALVPRLDLSPWLPPAQARRLGMPSRWAVAAARMAVEDARIGSLEGRRVCVVLATAFGAVLLTEKLVRQILDEGPEAAQPFYFSECVANAAAAQLAIALGAHGANVTITQREAGPLLALARGAHEVREGRADVAIVGSADEMTPLLHALLDRYRSLAKARPCSSSSARTTPGRAVALPRRASPPRERPSTPPRPRATGGTGTRRSAGRFARHSPARISRRATSIVSSRERPAHDAGTASRR